MANTQEKNAKEEATGENELELVANDRKKKEASNEKKIARKLYPCQFCGRTFSTAHGLGGHQNAHREERAAKQAQLKGKDLVTGPPLAFRPLLPPNTYHPFMHATQSSLPQFNPLHHLLVHHPSYCHPCTCRPSYGNSGSNFKAKHAHSTPHLAYKHNGDLSLAANHHPCTRASGSRNVGEPGIFHDFMGIYIGSSSNPMVPREGLPPSTNDVNDDGLAGFRSHAEGEVEENDIDLTLRL